MAIADSAIDHEALAYVRALLKPPLVRESVWATLAAALFAAISALAFAFAFAMVMAPPVTTSRLALEPSSSEILLPEGEGAARAPLP
ncbi:MAG: hypothetical protein Q8L66_08615 [Caulobacter sp.]|nr:hypothetical protein [Caulobacter sp.]